MRSTGLTAAAVAFGRAIGLGSDSARATSANSSALSDYERYDGIGLAGLVKAREVNAGELLEAAVARVEQRNPSINAVVNRMYDQAKAAIAAGLPSGPFSGVPYLLKDIGALYAGTVTTLGSSAFRNFIPDHDSEMVVRLKRAGLVIFGKTHTPEFGLSTSSESRLFGATHNPWNLEYSAGGSSGGSAAAIASGTVPMAYGNDGGGSIRIPAACCGLFGLKPTRARTPAGPDLGELWSGLAIAHAITRSVRDSAALLDATSGAEIGDPYWAPPQKRPYQDEVGTDPGRLRIAFTTKAWNFHDVDSECADAVAEAAKLCESLGHHMEEASPEFDEAARNKAVGVIITSQTRALLQRAESVLGRALWLKMPATRTVCSSFGASLFLRLEEIHWKYGIVYVPWVQADTGGVAQTRVVTVKVSFAALPPVPSLSISNLHVKNRAHRRTVLPLKSGKHAEAVFHYTRVLVHGRKRLRIAPRRSRVCRKREKNFARH